jgi:excisionase family DNA binding protein
VFDRSAFGTEHLRNHPLVASPQVFWHFPATNQLFGTSRPNIAPTVMRAARCGQRLLEHETMEGSQSPLALRPREAAKALGISPRLLWQLTKDGHIPCVRVGTGKRRSILYPIAELQAWLTRETVKPKGGEHDPR